ISRGCPVVRTNKTGVRRSCERCEGPTFAPESAQGLVSHDGGWYLAADDPSGDRGTTLWRLYPAPTAVASYLLRPEEADWNSSSYLEEIPLAVADGGTLTMTGATPGIPCYLGPRFEARVHDVATGAVVDSLPPWPTSTDAALRVIAYG